MFKSNLMYKNKEFRLILTASIISKLGDSIMTIAILWSIYSVTHSATLLGLITLMQLLPVILLSLHSGVYADRYSPKKLMIISDFSRFVLLILLILFWHFGIFKLVALYTIVFLLSTFTSYFEPASQVTIKNIVHSEDLIEANSLQQLTKNLANLFGLILGGTLVASIGIGNTFLINACSYLISGLLIISIKLTIKKKDKINKKLSNSIKESFRYLQRAPVSVKQSLFYLITINFSVAPLSIMMTLLAGRSDFHSYGLGLLNCSLAVGSIIGATISKKIIKITKSKSLISVFITLYCLSVFLCTLFKTIWLNCFLLLFTGVCSSLILIFVNTFIQRDTDKEYMGRISSIRSMALRIPPPIVALVYGSLVTSIGLIRITLILQVFTICTSFLISLFFKNKGSNLDVSHSNSQ